MEQFLDNPVVEIGGWGTAGVGMLLQVASSFDIADINPYITGVTGIAGFIFILYKISHIRLKTHKDKLEMEHQRMENKILEGILKHRAGPKDSSKDSPDDTVA